MNLIPTRIMLQMGHRLKFTKNELCQIVGNRTTCYKSSCTNIKKLYYYHIVISMKKICQLKFSEYSFSLLVYKDI